MDNDDIERFNIELDTHNKLAYQPPNINVQLKPHQLAALYKAKIMETNGKVYYDVPNPGRYISQEYIRRNLIFQGKFKIESNIGILGDIVGYGKTLTALGIIAQTSVYDIFYKHHEVFSCNSRSHSHFVGTFDKQNQFIDDDYIHTTLVVVPRGPVFIQWLKAIKNQTNLRVLAIEGLPFIRKELPGPGTSREEIHRYFENYDIVLIKSTTVKSLMDYYEVPYQDHPLSAWDRIMIDEAPDIITKIPLYGFRFMWLISATYESLLFRTYGSRNVLSYALRDILNEERMNLLLIKGKKDFVTRSFDVPLPEEHYYLCAMPAGIAAIHPFLGASVQERINANDIQGAIRELGGQNETEEELATLLTREIEREIRNKTREIEYINSLDIPQEIKDQRLTILDNELKRITERRANLIERISQLSEKSCAICYEEYKNPIVLPCTHVFCGGCLLNWMRNGNVCPECRAPIQSQRLIGIVKDKNNQSVNVPKPQILSKEETLIKIIRDKPNGKFLVFSRCDMTFVRLTERLEREGVSHMEIKGSTGTMMRILERFRNSELRVILLNTYHAGSGIDISCATDVIIFHSMGIDKTQAVGRAQRVGRTQPLHIHNLCYPNEMENHD